MEQELEGQLSSNSTDDPAKPLPKTPGEWFEYLCPTYMFFGMTYEEYWDGDNEAPKMYRKAYELKRRQANFDLWLQGAYVYEAILACSPTLNALKPSKPIDYRRTPFPLTAAEQFEAKEREEREKFEQFRAEMKAMAEQINARRKARRDSDGG